MNDHFVALQSRDRSGYLNLVFGHLMKFTATQVECSATDSEAIAAFRANDDTYLILSRSLSPSDIDHSLGLDGVYIEISDQTRSGYGGIASGRLGVGLLDLYFSNRGHGNLGAASLTVEFQIPTSDYERLMNTIAILFREHQTFQIET